LLIIIFVTSNFSEYLIVVFVIPYFSEFLIVIFVIIFCRKTTLIKPTEMAQDQETQQGLRKLKGVLWEL